MANVIWTETQSAISMLDALRAVLNRLSPTKPAAMSPDDEWYVLLDGQPVAVISNPRNADMFWFTWDIRPTDGSTIPTNLWSYEMDGQRTFRHVKDGTVTNLAIPATDSPMLSDGRVLLRGPLHLDPRLL